jgi:hypothetical protein
MSKQQLDLVCLQRGSDPAASARESCSLERFDIVAGVSGWTARRCARGSGLSLSGDKVGFRVHSHVGTFVPVTAKPIRRPTAVRLDFLAYAELLERSG